MKRFPYLAGALSLAVLLAVVWSVPGQVDKVLEKTKDLKKKVEGGQSTTNKPPRKTPPPPPKQAR